MSTNPRLQLWFFIAALALAAGLSFAIFRPYLDLLVLAAVLAIAFTPVQRRLTAWFGGRTGLAAAGSLTTVVVVVFVPLLLIAGLLLGEAREAYQRFFIEGRAQTLTELQQLVGRLLPGVQLDLASYLRQVLSFLVGNVGNVFTGLAEGALSIFIVALTLFYLFKDGTHLRQFLMRVSPLSDQHDARVLDKLRHAVNSIVLGSLAVAVIQGILAGIGFAMAGVPSATLWGGVAVFAALIPSVGTSIVLVPAVLYLLTQQSWGAAIGLAIWGALVVGLVDNFLRPKLLQQGIHLHPLLILLSVLGGLSVFGPIGFFVGPLTISLLVALLEIFNEDYGKYFNQRD